jgi:DDE superfamily endonuclease
MTPSPEWQVLLEGFRPLFTKPGYRYFCAFVLVFAHLDRRLWVTQVILAGAVQRHFTGYYRFLGQGRWSLPAVRQQLWSRCLEQCRDAAGRAFVGVDDTVCGKTGAQFSGLGWHHDPMNRQHPRKLTHGHCWVCLAGLAEQSGDHFVALFVGCALYLQAKACQAGEAFATKLELAARLLAELWVPSGTVLVVVADGAYARQPFVQALLAQECQLVSRLRRDTVFYDLPPVRRKRTKGRPRQYGSKHKAMVWAATQQRWHPVTLRLYGKEAHLQLKSRVVWQRTLRVKIRLVAVKWGVRPLVFLFATETKLTAAQIVRAYCARFALETGFRDSKQHFGLSTYQVRGRASIERMVHLCLWAQTLLRLACWQVKPEPIYGAWRPPLGYLTLSQQQRHSRERCRISAGSAPAQSPSEIPPGLPRAA